MTRRKLGAAPPRVCRALCRVCAVSEPDSCATQVDSRAERQLRLRAVTPVLPIELTHPESPADGLAAVTALRRLADRIEDAEVERAVRDGWTWAEIAEALGVTRQAVHKKHARRLKDVRALRR